MITHTLDATNQSLGRLASRIATLLRGKDTPAYSPNKMASVSVIVTNLDKLHFTGTKMKTTKHHRYSGYPGGLYTRTLEMEWAKSPTEVLRKAVYRMLPINRTRDKIISHLKFQ
jgi:large subunit ribosomal protein L13